MYTDTNIFKCQWGTASKLAHTNYPQWRNEIYHILRTAAADKELQTRYEAKPPVPYFKFVGSWFSEENHLPSSEVQSIIYNSCTPQIQAYLRPGMHPRGMWVTLRERVGGLEPVGGADVSFPTFPLFLCCKTAYSKLQT
jgi:hypothetical protein